MSRPPNPFKIAFCCETTNPFFDAVLEGVKHTTPPESGVQLMNWMGSSRISLAALTYLKPDALVIGPCSAELDGLIPPSTPQLLISNARQKKPGPSVVNDDVEVGRQAAKALIDAGYERLVVLGTWAGWHEIQREQGARDMADKRQVIYHSVDLSIPKIMEGQSFQDCLTHHHQKVRQTLSRIKPNTGVIFLNPLLVQETVEILTRDLGVQVPDEVGLILADLPAIGDETLGFVRLDGEEIGQQAVHLLLRKLQRPTQTLPPLTLIPPRGIFAGNTIRKHEGMRIYQKMEAWCAEHLQENVRVTDMARAIGYSRRSMEMKLKAHGLPSPYLTLSRLRLREAKRLLVDTSKNMEEIAAACGFQSSRAFANHFRQKYGLSPGTYRKQER